MPEVIIYADTVAVDAEKIENISTMLLKVIKNELPEEAHLYCVYNDILDEAKSRLRESVVVIT